MLKKKKKEKKKEKHTAADSSSAHITLKKKRLTDACIRKNTDSWMFIFWCMLQTVGNSFEQYTCTYSLQIRNERR